MSFTRAWNLERHQQDQHRDQGVRFLNYDPTSAQFNIAPETTTELTRLPATNPPAPTAPMYHTQPNRTPWNPPSWNPSPEPSASSPTPPLSPTMSEASATVNSIQTLNSIQKLQLERVLESSTYTQARSRRTSTASEATSSEATWSEVVSTQFATLSEPLTRPSSHIGSDYSSSTTNSEGLADSEGSGCSCRKQKRKRSLTTGRMLDAEKKDATPTYHVKRSKKTPGQQRELD